MRILSPTIQLGQLLQAVTVSIAIGAGLFQGGIWVSDIRADLRSETASRIEHDAALAAMLASQSRDESDARKAAIDAVAATQNQMLASMARIERSFQHVFAATQPQPQRHQ